jgi:hypothetical protein
MGVELVNFHFALIGATTSCFVSDLGNLYLYLWIRDSVVIFIWFRGSLHSRPCYDDASRFHASPFFWSLLVWSQWIMGPLYHESFCNDLCPLYFMFFLRDWSNMFDISHEKSPYYFINNFNFFPRHLILNN